MIKGLGLDLQQVSRVERAMENPGFVQRVFTRREQAYLDSRGAMRAQSAAGLFSAKEAALKALGTGIGKTGLSEVEITHDLLGAPQAVLTGEALQRLNALGACRMLVSITHDGGFAAAVCIAEAED